MLSDSRNSSEKIPVDFLPHSSHFNNKYIFIIKFNQISSTMKKNSIVFGIALLMGIMFSTSTFSQVTSAPSVSQNVSLTVDGSALLAVTGSVVAEENSVHISLAGATEAGAEVQTSATNDTTRLRVSSLVENLKSRSISASILPALTGSGTTLSLELIDPGDFLPQAANAGTSTGPKDMTAGGSQDLVTGITTCWSGTGVGNGYVIKYVYAKASGATTLTSKAIVVTFTISAEV